MEQMSQEANTKYIRVDAELLPYFRQFDFFDHLSCLDKPGSLALGAFVRGEDGKDHPAALLVTEPDPEDGSFVIRWLYVESDHRGQGIGSRLLYLIFAEAEGRKHTRVVVRISDEYLDAAPEWDPERFFMDCLFEEEDSVMDEFVFMVGELTESREYKKIIAAGTPVQTISELSKEEKKEIYGKTERYVRLLADEEISCVLTERGTHKAAIFVRQYGDVYYPFCMIGENSSDMERLARSALIFLTEAEPSEMLRVECTSMAGEKIMEKLGLPGKKYMVSYREASVADYLKLLEEDRRRITTSLE